MKLKFKKTVAAGRQIFREGQEYEIGERHAAEVYMAHGYAEAASGESAGELRTLRRRHPAEKGKPRMNTNEHESPAAGPSAGKTTTAKT